MKYCLLPTLCLLALLPVTACSSTRSPGNERETVQRDVEACVRALYAGDLDTVLDLTHPRILDQLGGRERVAATMGEALQPMRDSGMRVESFMFPRPPDFLQAGPRRYVVVPTLAVLVLGGQRVESLNFQVGVLEPGARGWLYVEGARLDAGNVHAVFADFPAGYTFPAIYRKKL